METGTWLGERYRIDQVLGRGGFGAVYLATDEQLGVLCAIKENLNVSPETERQFKREATLLATLRHPSLPRVTNHFITGGCQYLVMDYVEGEDLKERLRREGPLPEAEAVKWGAQICAALTYLHTRQPPVIHRDIKPANIKLDASGEAILVDFGIAKTGGAGQKTTTSAMGLTPGFAPPEQYGTSGTDARTDEYALAATLYCLLTGKPPPDSMERLLGNARLIPLAELRPDVSAGVAAAITQALEIQPEARLANLADFGTMLQGETIPPAQPAAETLTLPPEGEATPTLSSPLVPSLRPRLRRSVVAGIIGAVLLTLAGVWAGRTWLFSATPTSSPVPAALALRSPTLTESFTPTFLPPTARPTAASLTPSNTPTPTPADTLTPAPNDTATLTPSETSTPLPTATPTLPVISSANAGQLALRRQLGRGRLLRVQWSPDGRYLGARTSRGGTIFDGQTLAVVTETANLLGFGPAPNLVALGGALKIDLLDLVSGSISQTIDIDPLNAVAAVFSPDGQRLAIVGADNGLVLVNLSSRLQQNLAAGVAGYRASGQAQIAFSPDGKYLVSDLGVWEAATGKLMWRGLKHIFAISADSQMAADEGGIRLLRSGVMVRDANLAPYFPLLLHPGLSIYNVDSLAFTPDVASLLVFADRTAQNGRQVVSILRWPVKGGGGPEILVPEIPDLDISQLSRTFNYGPYGTQVYQNVAFDLDPSGARFYSWSPSGVLRLRSIALGQGLTAGLAFAIGQLPAFSHDGQTVAMPDAAGIELFDAASGAAVNVLKSVPKPQTIAGIAYLGHNLLVEQPGAAIDNAGSPLNLIIVDTQNDLLLQHFQSQGARMRYVTAARAASPDGRWFTIGYEVYSAVNGQSVRSLQTNVVTFSPSGEIVSGKGQTVEFLDVDTGKINSSLKTQGGRPVGKLAFAPDGAWLLSALGDVWDVAHQAGAGVFDCAAAYAVISPGGKLVVCSDRTIWNVETGKMVAQFPGTLPSTGDLVTFSADGRRLLLWNSHTETVEVWEVPALSAN